MRPGLGADTRLTSLLGYVKADSRHIVAGGVNSLALAALIVMLKLILSRLLQGVMVLLIISFLIFALLTRAGGDAVSMLENTRSSNETIESIRRIHGLDRPLMERYRNWLAEVARGDLGHSLVLQAPVWSLIRIPLLRTGMSATVEIGRAHV